MKKTILLAACVLSGCSSSGPVPIGKDTFMITKQSAGGMFVSGSEVKADILKEAYAFCTSQKKHFQIVNSNELNAIPGRMPSAEVQFMCLEEGDKEIARPKMKREADITIETRSR